MTTTDDMFSSSLEVVQRLQPSYPVLCLRPSVLTANVRHFIDLFPGRVMYAVKCNPHPLVIKGLYAAGIRDFDTASLPEIGQVAELYPEAVCHFMHPVKARAAIKMARTAYGVQYFAIDHSAELNKILSEVDASEIGVVVRLKTPVLGDSVYELSTKFGCEIETACELLAASHQAGCKTGLTFHVGSQCKNPRAYADGIQRIATVIKQSQIIPDIVDVGGGFPVPYMGANVPPLEEFMQVIRSALAELSLPPTTQIYCEPGRALVANACSLITQVLLRKDDRLYINDGIYGSLNEMLLSKLRMPVTVVGRAHDDQQTMTSFTLCGPTCDSLDVIPGTFELPSSVDEGDWLEVHQIGAYSTALATHFNGFYPETMVLVRDEY